MEFFTEIARQVDDLRMLLGDDVATGELAGAVRGLDDEGVVAVLAQTTAICRSMENLRIVASGVAGARSTREHGHGIGCLVGQRPDLCGVIDSTIGQRGGHDPAAGRVHADTQDPPRAPFPGPVLPEQPLPWPAQLRSRAVHQQMQRPPVRAGSGWQLDASGPPADGRVIRNRQLEAEQPKDRAARRSVAAAPSGRRRATSALS